MAGGEQVPSGAPRWRAPGGLLVVVGGDPRRRYRFITEPLRAAGIEPHVLPDSGSIAGIAWRARRALVERPHIALVLMFDTDVRSLLWTRAIRLYSEARVVVRFGGVVALDGVSLEKRIELQAMASGHPDG